MQQGTDGQALRSRLRLLEVAIRLIEERNRAKSGEDCSGFLERLCGGFSVAQGDEAAGEAEMGLSLLQYEAVIGPALDGLFVGVAGLFDRAFGFRHYGVTREQGVAVSGRANFHPGHKRVGCIHLIC